MTEQLLMHIYGQREEHDDVCIAGEPGRLKALRDAITAALGTGHGKTTAFCSDGEGYQVLVHCIGAEQARRFITPYTNTDNEGECYPWDSAEVSK